MNLNNILSGQSYEPEQYTQWANFINLTKILSGQSYVNEQYIQWAKL